MAADADPTTGYHIYWNGAAKRPGSRSGWQVIGGTSGAAPVWARSVGAGRLLARLRRHSSGVRRPGAVPRGRQRLRRRLQRRPARQQRLQRHQRRAVRRRARLRRGLAAWAAQRRVAGHRVVRRHAALRRVNRRRLRRARSRARCTCTARTSPATAIHYSARGLPPGLRLDGATRRHLRSPRRAAGQLHRSIDGHVDANGATATTSFRWTVGRRPCGSPGRRWPATRSPCSAAHRCGAWPRRGAPPIGTLKLRSLPGSLLR